MGKKILLILVSLAFFMALLSAAQASSFVHYDLNTSVQDLNILAADVNVAFAYLSNSDGLRGCVWDPLHTADCADISTALVSGTIVKLEVMHVPGQDKIWVAMLVDDGSIWSSECTVSGYTVTSCNAASPLYPWSGTPTDRAHDFAISFVRTKTLGDWAALYYSKYDVSGNYTLNYTDLATNNALDSQSNWETLGGTVDIIYTPVPATDPIEDIVPNDVYDGDGTSAVAFKEEQGTTDTCMLERVTSQNPPYFNPAVNGSTSCQDHGGNSVALLYMRATNPLTLVEYDVTVLGYYDEALTGVWKFKHCLDNSCNADAGDKSFTTGYMGPRACNVDDYWNSNRDTAQWACTWVSNSNDPNDSVFQGGGTMGIYWVVPDSITANDLTYDYLNYSAPGEWSWPQTVWDGREGNFGILGARYVSGTNITPRYSYVVPSTNLVLPSDSSLTAAIVGTNNDQTVTCTGQTISNLIPTNGSSFTVEIYKTAVGSGTSVTYTIPGFVTDVDLKSSYTTTISGSGDLIYVSNAPSNIGKQFKVPVPSGYVLWSQRQAGGGYSLANSDCQTTNTGNQTISCDDGTYTWRDTIGGTTGYSGVGPGSGAGADPPPTPEFPVYGTLMAVALILIIIAVKRIQHQRKNK